MCPKLLLIRLTVVVLALSCVSPAPAQQGGGKHKHRQQADAGGLESPEMLLTSLPPAVRQTALVELGGGVVGEVNRTTEDGEVVYEIEINRGGELRSITVAEDGGLRSRQYFLAELPSAVQKTITGLQRFGKLNQIFRVNTNDEVNYEVELLQADGPRFFSVSLDGVHEATQQRMTELSEPVQKSVREQVGEGSLFHIYRSELDGGKIFYVLLMKEAKRRTLSIDADGKVVATQLYPAELPPAVQKGITKIAENAKLGYIERCEEDGQNLYDVAAVVDGAKREYVVGEDGALLSTVIALSEAPEPVQKALREKAGDEGRITRVEKLAKESAFDAEIVKEGKRLSLTVSESGKVQ